MLRCCLQVDASTGQRRASQHASAQRIAFKLLVTPPETEPVRRYRAGASDRGDSKLSEIVTLKGNGDGGLESISCLGKCLVSATGGLPHGVPHGDVVGIKDATTMNELALLALSQQPVSIAIDADMSFLPLCKTSVMTATLQWYKIGVLLVCSTSSS